MQTILVIDDDESLRDTIGMLLESEGFRAVLAGDGKSGLDQAMVAKPNLILVDLRLPVISGVDVCKQLRQSGVETPIIVLSGVGDEFDKVLLLEIGADDYLPKPFNPRELVARIRAVLRRAKPTRAADEVPEVLSVGDVDLDPATRSVQRAGQPVDLTSVEFNLLEVLLREAGRVVTRERLVNAVLSRKFMPFDRSIDMHVSKVRRKLGDSEEDGDHIKTIRGVGYMFARPAAKPKK